MSPLTAATDLRRRDTLSALALGCMLALASQARAERREIDDGALRLSLDLPSDWIPIPRAEIVEAGERARAAGAPAEWTVRAAWQRVPHQRWFTLPHLLLETRPSGATAASPPGPPAHEVGQAGTRTVHRHRSAWSAPGEDAQLTLLSWSDEQALFARIAASLRLG